MKLSITILKYHWWYLCQISLQLMPLLPIQTLKKININSEIVIVIYSLLVFFLLLFCIKFAYFSFTYDPYVEMTLVWCDSCPFRSALAKFSIGVRLSGWWLRDHECQGLTNVIHSFVHWFLWVVYPRWSHVIFRSWRDRQKLTGWPNFYPWSTSPNIFNSSLQPWMSTVIEYIQNIL